MRPVRVSNEIGGVPKGLDMDLGFHKPCSVYILFGI